MSVATYSAKIRQRTSSPAHDWAHAFAYLILFASVCFSTGEGLRLLPYAGGATEEGINASLPARVNTLQAAAPEQYAYGLEASAQKLTKQRTDADWPAVAAKSAAASSSVRLLGYPHALEAVVGYSSRLCASRPAGRAPPLA